MTDVHSFSNPETTRHSHLQLDLEVDFDRKVIRGSATYTIDNPSNSKEMKLDTRKLKIKDVKDEAGKVLPFSLGTEVEHLGQALKIDISAAKGRIIVYYETSPDADALQWLEPSQTLGKSMPFLFTQSQAILARTWVPCQDSPGVKFTYSARVKVPKGMMALMSATNAEELSADGVYHFEMGKPVSSYLLALACGGIVYKKLGEECGVYAEPGMLDAAAWEFADLQAMIDAAGELYGKYLWGKYDVLVLPPSFPFGGMENPKLTFATPTIIAGDRSLVSLVAHELAHSWSGNLVTNATWNDFWLNEGFTVYFEHRIMEHIYGKDYADMLAVLGYNELLHTLDDMGYQNPDTRLRIDLSGRNPDDGVTDIAYEKGRYFLTTIEKFVGRPAWDAFVKKYFNDFAFQAMTTDYFLGYLRANLLDQYPGAFEKLNVTEWVDAPGLPDNCAKPSSAIFDNLGKMTELWLNDRQNLSILDTNGWTTHHWNFFLRKIAERITLGDVERLDEKFQLTLSQNAEIACDWLWIALRYQYAAAYGRLEQFLLDVGRRKFVKPLYQQMAAQPATLELAKNIYRKARPGYHSVTVRTIDEILNWKP